MSSTRTTPSKKRGPRQGLNHPNICTVYEVGEVDGEDFIAMEYVAGRPLSELIPEGGLADA